MINAFDQLKEFSDIGALKPALHSLLSRYGSVERLDILVSSQAGKRQALCFLRMGSAEQEHQITRELGVGRFAGDLVMIVDLKTPGTERDNAPTLQAA
ncbi:MAG: RNA-binding protein [Polaromonas sp.]|nr:RNA-binding protein [Polaromonas sp.]